MGTVITKPAAQVTNTAVEICGHQKKQKRKLLGKKENRNPKAGLANKDMIPHFWRLPAQPVYSQKQNYSLLHTDSGGQVIKR